jgi:hypothetical protein
VQASDRSSPCCARRARAGALAAGAGCIVAGGTALAGSVGSESSIGIAADYASNPEMLPSAARAAESAAVLMNLPATYNSDTQTLDLIPRVRFAQTHGDVSLLSNYQYLDGDWRLTSENNVYTAAGTWHRDSTLYNPFENAALSGIELHRMEETGSLGWQRQLSERDDLQFTGSWDHLAYGANSVGILDSYNYGQASVAYDHAFTERLRASIAVGFGQYELLNHSYRNDDRFAQLSIDRSLTERWTLDVMANYSYLRSKADVGELYCPAQSILLCEIIPSLFEIVTVPVHSGGGSGNGAIKLDYLYERGTLDLAVSRAIQPSGFGALLTQDDASIRGSYDWTERWKLGATLHASRVSDPLHQIHLSSFHYYDLDLSATWLWTEHWTLGILASTNAQEIGGPHALGATVSLTLSRQFGRVRL